MERSSQWLSMDIRIFRQLPDLLCESSLDFSIITLKSIFCGLPDYDPTHAHLGNNPGN